MELKDLKGVGEASVKLFAKLGIESVADLTRHYPARYEDRTETLTGIIAFDPRESFIRRGLTITKTALALDDRLINLTFFNAQYVKNALVKGGSYRVFGKVEDNGGRLEMVNPVFEPAARPGRVTGRVMPIYRLTAGLKQHTVRLAVEQALKLSDFSDPLPKSLRERYNLCQLGYALTQIHAPSDAESLALARRRLVFEELFFLALGLARLKKTRAVRAGAAFKPFDLSELNIPFELTGAQSRAIAQIEKDLTGGRLMSRLVQGDVGSGKTAVAAAACLAAARSGYQAAFMVPTEILAVQHYNTLSAMCAGSGVTVGLLTGKSTAKEKNAARAAIKSGETQIAVGTHAIIADKTEFFNLGLIVADEQHRFGVKQREKLAEKGENTHSLFMSATPIPRTLALIMYGELDISVLNELPPGRKPAATYAVSERLRPRIDKFIAENVDKGGQVYIVCPLIESVDDEGRAVVNGMKEAVAVLERTRSAFPGYSAELLHGKLPPREKNAVMERFKAGETNILVSTTVIEVGVDVPNATLMVVENADRFGLSQLHQLRGRVGRGSRESYCVLVRSEDGGAERLKILEKCNDGFELAQADLAIRGPGEFFGTRQHGLPAMKLANLSDPEDLSVTEDAREAAEYAAGLLEREEYRAVRERSDALIERLEGS